MMNIRDYESDDIEKTRQNWFWSLESPTFDCRFNYQIFTTNSSIEKHNNVLFDKFRIEWNIFKTNITKSKYVLF